MAYPLTEKEFRYFYAKMPRLCVDVVIGDDNNRILLTKRSIDPYLNQWHLPGGTVYFGETIVAAVRRVAKEELGMEVVPGRILDILVYPDEYRGDWHGWPIGICVETTIKSGTPQIDNQAGEFGFFEKLPRAMIEIQKKFIIEKLGFKEEVTEK